MLSRGDNVVFFKMSKLKKGILLLQTINDNLLALALIVIKHVYSSG